MKKSYEEIYKWENLLPLFEDFLLELVNKQKKVADAKVSKSMDSKSEKRLESLGFSEDAKDPKELTRFLMDEVYPYRMRSNHPRYFAFIPNDISPYSVFGEFLNSIHNPFGGGFDLSEGTYILEKKLVDFMGEKAGYDLDSLGGQFVSGGSMANLTALIVSRDDKLKAEEFTRARVYVSDQTHSSVAKAVHLMGLTRDNVRKIGTDEFFRMDPRLLREAIEKDLAEGLKPFLVVGSAGTTNTGSIDPLEEIADLCQEYGLWFHVDGAYGASILLSSHKDKLKGIEKSDSLSWDGHKWLFQTYGCATVLCKDRKKMLRSYHVDPEYLKDVESSEEKLNFWDMGMELTKPARGMRLWFMLQTVGLKAMQEAIDQGFIVADWLEEEIKKYDHFEIVSHSNLGIVNFRYYNEKYSSKELDEINKRLSAKALERGYALYLTTELKNKIVLRFCCNNALTSREEIRKIVQQIEEDIESLNL